MTAPPKVSKEDLSRLHVGNCCDCWQCGSCIEIVGAVVERLEWLEEQRAAANRPEKCEGCKAPATTSDNDGVPLCRKCADELLASVRKAAGVTP